jgi:hypothetical protein
MHEGRRLLRVVIVVVATATDAGGRMGLPVQAAPIKHHHVAEKGQTHRTGWQKFLDGGAAHWQKADPPKIDLHIRELMDKALHGPHAASTRNVQYLEWRRALNPARFDHWHPKMGPMLQKLIPPPSTSHPSTGTVTQPQTIGTGSVAATNTPSSTPSSSSSSSPIPGSRVTSSDPGTGTGTTTPQQIDTTPSPAAIPEPSTWTMALVMIGSGLWWRYRNGRPAKSLRND